jgi:hypothetical protein
MKSRFNLRIDEDLVHLAPSANIEGKFKGKMLAVVLAEVIFAPLLDKGNR